MNLDELSWLKMNSSCSTGRFMWNFLSFHPCSGLNYLIIIAKHFLSFNAWSNKKSYLLTLHNQCGIQLNQKYTQQANQIFIMFVCLFVFLFCFVFFFFNKIIKPMFIHFSLSLSLVQVMRVQILTCTFKPKARAKFKREKRRGKSSE